MEYDKDKVDEAVLALLFLTQCGGGRAWKGHDWDALGRLHEKGMILDPVGKAKSVVLTEEGENDARNFSSSSLVPLIAPDLLVER
ncbi:MAG TPA: DUF6429 family protein [Opitutaceae bacterium]|nr:DUF6429 family protein [Opitutaceae bacterium]